MLSRISSGVRTAILFTPILAIFVDDFPVLRVKKFANSHT
jgi:hypothetical protein